jgi:hypothetical protein
MHGVGISMAYRGSIAKAKAGGGNIENSVWRKPAKSSAAIIMKWRNNNKAAKRKTGNMK